jgi:benzoylformate decarboxylase
VWFAPGSPIPDGAAVIQLEESPRRLAQNFPITVGLVAGSKAGLSALLAAVESGADAAFRSAARERNTALAALRQEEVTAQRARAERRWSRVPMSTARLMAELAHALPREAIVVDESITASVDLWRTLSFEGPGDYHGARGGGIGQALPGALGVKLAHPDRPVVAISGDGSAMYSIQALWTAAHHDLAVVYVILSNREYRILKHNMDTYRQRFGAKPDRPYLHMDLATPELGFVDMAKGMGVPAERVTRPEEVPGALARGLASGGPYLLDVAVEAKA